MNRFLVFAFDIYCSSGGMDDFQTSFEGLEEAKNFVNNLNHDWYQIYDSEKDYMVYETEVTF